MTGEPFALASDVGGNVVNGRAAFAASDTVVSYMELARTGPLVWRSRSGAQTGQAAPSASYRSFSLSRDASGVVASRGAIEGSQTLGSTIFVSLQDPKSGYDIWQVGPNSSQKPLLNSPSAERAPRLSPDGKWLAYMSNESGQYETFVTPLANLSARRQVSIDGGLFPTWHGQEELFFISADGWLNALPISVANGSITAGFVTRLFQLSPQARAAGSPYVPTSDGQRFLVRATDAVGSPGLAVIQNWLEDVKRRVPTR